MKATRFLQGVGLLIALMTGLISCNQNADERNKPRTPLFVYFNPLLLDMNVENLMPYFVNYPTDWAKMGLRNYPMTVTYDYFHPTWMVTATSQYVFFATGCLSEQSKTSFRYEANGFDVISFEYDDDAKLVRIISELDGRYKNRKLDDGFTYDVNGRLVRRDINSQGTFYYLYHENGALKAIVPKRDGSGVYEAGVTLGRMDFDSLARMVRFESPYTTNLFLEDINRDKRGKSVMTFAYTDGLCTRAVEKMAVEFDQGVDTLVNVSSFTYNSHGDLASWNYKGAVYKSEGNRWWVDDMEITVTYDYVYDEIGNWTQAKIILPKNIDEIPPLRVYYKSHMRGYTSQDISSFFVEGEVPFLSIERTIDYWGENLVNALQETMASEKMETEKSRAEKDEGLRYRGTDIFGLSGEVKLVTGEYEYWKFDPQGNLISQKNSYDEVTTYEYMTPTSYQLDGLEKTMMNITIKDGVRSDIDSENNNIELNQEYTFDDRKRLIQHLFCSHMAIIKRTYQYEGDSGYPSTMVEETPDGIITYHYTYLKFDKKANWTERKVSYVTEYDEYDDDMNYIGKKRMSPEEYIEKRSIEYW